MKPSSRKEMKRLVKAWKLDFKAKKLALKKVDKKLTVEAGELHSLEKSILKLHTKKRKGEIIDFAGVFDLLAGGGTLLTTDPMLMSLYHLFKDILGKDQWRVTRSAISKDTLNDLVKMLNLWFIKHNKELVGIVRSTIENSGNAPKKVKELSHEVQNHYDKVYTKTATAASKRQDLWKIVSYYQRILSFVFKPLPKDNSASIECDDEIVKLLRQEKLNKTDKAKLVKSKRKHKLSDHECVANTLWYSVCTHVSHIDNDNNFKVSDLKPLTKHAEASEVKQGMSYDLSGVFYARFPNAMFRHKKTAELAKKQLSPHDYYKSVLLRMPTEYVTGDVYDSPTVRTVFKIVKPRCHLGEGKFSINHTHSKHLLGVELLDDSMSDSRFVFFDMGFINMILENADRATTWQILCERVGAYGKFTAHLVLKNKRGVVGVVHAYNLEY